MFLQKPIFSGSVWSAHADLVVREVHVEQLGQQEELLGHSFDAVVEGLEHLQRVDFRDARGDFAGQPTGFGCWKR